MLRRIAITVIILVSFCAIANAQGKDQIQIAITIEPYHENSKYIEGTEVTFNVFMERTKNEKQLPINMDNKILLATFPDSNTYVNLEKVSETEEKYRLPAQLNMYRETHRSVIPRAKDTGFRI